MPFRYPVSPTLREFLYDVLYNLQGDKDQLLNDSYRELGRTNSRAKKFADRASLEQICHISTLCGIQWCMVFFDDAGKPKTIRQLFENYKEGGDNPMNTRLNKLIEKKIYVTTDKQFIHYLGTAAELISSEEYRRNIELSRVGYHVRKWTRKLNSETVAQDIEDSQSLNYLSRLFLSCIFTEKQLSISEQDSRILCFLFCHNTIYVKKKFIEDKFNGMYKPNKITNSLRRLIQHQFVQKNIDPKQGSYKITGLGEAETIKLLNGVLKQITFF